MYVVPLTPALPPADLQAAADKLARAYQERNLPPPMELVAPHLAYRLPPPSVMQAGGKAGAPPPFRPPPGMPPPDFSKPPPSLPAGVRPPDFSKPPPGLPPPDFSRPPPSLARPPP